MSNASCSIERRTHLEQLWDHAENLGPCAEAVAKGGLVVGALATFPLHAVDFVARRTAGACCGVKLEDRWVHASPIKFTADGSIQVPVPKSDMPVKVPLRPKSEGAPGVTIDTKSHNKGPVKEVAGSVSGGGEVEAKGASGAVEETAVNWTSSRGNRDCKFDKPEQVFTETMAQVKAMFGPLARLNTSGLYHDGSLPPVSAFVVDEASRAPQNVDQIPVAMKTLVGQSAAIAIGATYPNPPGALLRSQDGVYLGTHASVVTDGVQGHESEITYPEVRNAQVLVGTYVAALIDTIAATQSKPCEFLQQHHEVLLGMIARAVKDITNESGEACFVAVADYHDGTAVLGVGDCAARLVCNNKGVRSVVPFTAQPEGAATMALGGRAEWLPAYRFQVVDNVERILLASDGVLQAKDGLVDLGRDTKQGEKPGVVGGTGGGGVAGARGPQVRRLPAVSWLWTKTARKSWNRSSFRLEYRNSPPGVSIPRPSARPPSLVRGTWFTTPCRSRRRDCVW